MKKINDYIKDNIGYILILSAILIIFVIGQCENGKTDREDGKTIVVERTDTIRDTITHVNNLPKYIITKDTITDTLKLKGDTVKLAVEVPIEQKVYKDSDYYAVISGYKPFLDTLKVYPKQVTITRETTQYKQNKWALGITVGGGYGIFNKKPDVFVGLGITYRIK